MTKLLLSLLLLCLVSCGTSLSESSSLPQSTPEVALREKHREDYARRWAAFRCEKGDVPVTHVHKIDEGDPRPVAILDELQLTLKFGKAVTSKGRPHHFRTESRYILSASAKQELGRAESMLTEPHQGMVQVLYYPSSGCVLVEEELSGAGNLMRHIVFERDPASSEWRVHYLELPRRQTLFEDTSVGHVLSVADGKVYVETDGLYYAFPIHKHLAINLEFSPG